LNTHKRGDNIETLESRQFFSATLTGEVLAATDAAPSTDVVADDAVVESAGKVSVQDITLVQRVNKASPKLF